VLNAASAFAVFQRDPVAAKPLVAEELPLARALGDLNRLIPALINAGLLAELHQLPEAATALMEEAYQLASGFSSNHLAGVTAANVGGIALSRGQLDRAAAWFTTAITALRPTAYAWGLAGPLGGLGIVRARQGRIEEAVALTAEALELALGTGDPSEIAAAVYRVAHVAGVYGSHAVSARLVGAREGIEQRLGIQTSPAVNVAYRRWRSEATASLGERQVAAEVAAGRALSIVDAVELARHVVATIEADFSRTSSTDLARLTPREREVLRLVMAGQTDREIGDILFLSHRTVNAHVSRILAKLEAPTRRAATIKGHALGLLPDRRTPNASA
jgi:DNA-binding CsgD family transcriptional regulator